MRVPNDANYIRQFVYISDGWKLDSYQPTAYYGYGNMTGWNGVDYSSAQQIDPWKWKKGELVLQPSSLVWMGEIVGVSPALGYYGPGPYALNHNGRTNLMMADSHVGTFDAPTVNSPGNRFRFY